VRVPFADMTHVVQCWSCNAVGAAALSGGVVDRGGRLFCGEVVCASCDAPMFDVKNGKWVSLRGGEERVAPRELDIAEMTTLVCERLVAVDSAETALIGPWGPGPAKESRISAGSGCSATVQCDAEWASVLLLSHPGGGLVDLLVGGVVVATADTHQESGSAWLEVPFPAAIGRAQIGIGAHHGSAGVGFAGFVLYSVKPDGRYARVPAFNRGNPYSPYIEPKLQALAGTPKVLEVGGGDRRRRNPWHINVEYAPFQGADLVADVHHLPFCTGSFDAVVSQAVFEHLARPFEAAKELMRVLKPGGLLVCEVAFLQPLHGVPFHYFNMTLDGVSELFPDLEGITREWFGSLSDTVSWMMNAVGAEARVGSEAVNRVICGLQAIDSTMNPDDYLPVASGVVLAGRKPA
jgi:SAM-dependent methyltransferase